MKYLYAISRSHLQLLQFAVDVDIKVWVHGAKMFRQHAKPAKHDEQDRLLVRHVNACLCGACLHAAVLPLIRVLT